MLIYLSRIEDAGERSRFEILYHTYRKEMLHLAFGILSDMRDTEDVVHDAFLKLIKILDRIDDPRAPKTRSLVLTVVERTAIDLYRRRKKRPHIPFEEEWGEDSATGSIDAKADLAAAMAALPVRYRQVLLLRYDNGFSENEVAELLSMSKENVHKTVQRAKKKLAALLDREEV